MTRQKFPLIARVLFASVLSFLSACSSLGIGTDASYEDKTHEKTYKNGSLTSDEGGISLFGGPDKKAQDSNGIGVNGYLWRASLDTIAFMPIVSADPFGGVIITDWYAQPDTPNERMKLNVFIRDRDLRADGVKVSVFRQIKGPEGSWTDASVATATSGSLENAILTRARQIRLAQKQVQ
jgi:hypothetical protein